MKGGDREKTEKAGKSSHVCIHMCMAIRNNMYHGSWRRPRLGGGRGRSKGKRRWAKNVGTEGIKWSESCCRGSSIIYRL